MFGGAKSKITKKLKQDIDKFQKQNSDKKAQEEAKSSQKKYNIVVDELKKFHLSNPKRNVKIENNKSTNPFRNHQEGDSRGDNLLNFEQSPENIRPKPFNYEVTPPPQSTLTPLLDQIHKELFNPPQRSTEIPTAPNRPSSFPDPLGNISFNSTLQNPLTPDGRRDNLPKPSFFDQTKSSFIFPPDYKWVRNTGTDTFDLHNNFNPEMPEGVSPTEDHLKFRRSQSFREPSREAENIEKEKCSEFRDYTNQISDVPGFVFDEDPDIDIPSEIIKKIKNIRNFSGLPNEKKRLSIFFKELETSVKVCAPRLMRYDPVRLDKIMSQVLSYHLCENALLYYVGLSEKEKGSYTLSKRALLMRFGDTLSPTAIQNTLDNLKQGYKMSVVALKEQISYWVDTLLSVTMQDAPIAEKAYRREFLCHDRFLRAVNDQIYNEMALKGFPKTFEAAFEEALAIETAFIAMRPGKNTYNVMRTNFQNDNSRTSRPFSRSSSLRYQNRNNDTRYFSNSISNNSSTGPNISNQIPTYHVNQSSANLPSRTNQPSLNFDPTIPPPFNARGTVSQNTYFSNL